MIPSSLEWFADLCAHYADAPPEAQLLGKELLKQFNSANERVQVNRAFRRHLHILYRINSWFCGTALSAAVNAKACSITVAARDSAKSAISAVLAGQVPSNAWGMGAQRGVNIGFSTTMEAAALVGYLMKVHEELLPECLYPGSEELKSEWLLLAFVFDKRAFIDESLFTQTAALTVAAKLFNVNADNIRKYSGPGPVSDQSEAGMALYGLTRLGLLPAADR